MYLDFFDFKEHPFNLTPDTDFIFPSTHYSQAINYLLYGIEQKKGFILITGAVGAGKTTLCRSLLRKLDREQVEVAIILNSFLSEFELLKSINKDFSLGGEGKNKEELIEELNEFLLRQRELNKTAVLVIDECQNLSFPVLEQIRMLSNLETEKEKLLQIILVGQPEFQDILNSPEIRQLNQRITVKYHMAPLNKQETEKYIYHRIKIASADNHKIHFTPEAIKKIFKFSQGVPRLINVLADYVLLNAFIHETYKITEGIVSEAIHEVQGKTPPVYYVSGKLPKKVLIASLFIVLLGSSILLKTIFSSNQNINQPLPEDTKAHLQNPITEPQFYISEPPPEETKAAFKKDSLKEKEETPLTINNEIAMCIEFFKKWGIEENQIMNYLTQSKNQTYSCETIAQNFNFKISEIWTTLETLKKIRLAGLVNLNEGSRGILEEITKDKITVRSKQGKEEYGLTEFKKIWDGKILFFYEDSFDIESILYAGITGESVLELQEKLWKLNFFKSNFTGIFDETTEKAVKFFQNSYNLVPDGVVGKEMQLLLYRIFREDKLPLIQIKE